LWRWLFRLWLQRLEKGSIDGVTFFIDHFDVVDDPLQRLTLP
jgi:hypothetical protein